jgi:hypothetical protein
MLCNENCRMGDPGNHLILSIVVSGVPRNQKGIPRMTGGRGQQFQIVIVEEGMNLGFAFATASTIVLAAAAGPALGQGNDNPRGASPVELVIATPAAATDTGREALKTTDRIARAQIGLKNPKPPGEARTEGSVRGNPATGACSRSPGVATCAQRRWGSRKGQVGRTSADDRPASPTRLEPISGESRTSLWLR